MLCSLKKQGILSQATAWKKLEGITLSEIIQSQKENQCVMPLLGAPGGFKWLGTESGKVVARPENGVVYCVQF